MPETLAPAQQPYDPVVVMKDLASQLSTALLNDSVNRARAAAAHDRVAELEAELAATREELSRRPAMGSDATAVDEDVPAPSPRPQAPARR